MNNKWLLPIDTKLEYIYIVFYMMAEFCSCVVV